MNWKAVLVTAPPALRDQLRGLTTPTLIRKCAALRASGSAIETGTKKVLRSLAQRYQHLAAEARTLERTLTELTQRANPILVGRFRWRA